MRGQQVYNQILEELGRNKQSASIIQKSQLPEENKGESYMAVCSHFASGKAEYRTWWTISLSQQGISYVLMEHLIYLF